MYETGRAPFGSTPTGEAVEELFLDNGSLSCSILTFGAALRTLYVPDRTGRPLDIVLGYDTLGEYRDQDAYPGAVVGRFANRIARGRFSLNGEDYVLAVNNGPNHLHGGAVGFSHRVWTVEELDTDRAVLSLASPDGEEGYPGTLRARVAYRLEGNALTIRYQAVCDRDTPCNLTNHSYFNLAGHSSGPVLGQEICLHASRYLPTDGTSIPLGELAPVEGTPMDLRRRGPIGARIDEPFLQLVHGRGYDHCYVVDGPEGALRPAAWACSPASGVVMEVETTMPGVQFYTGNYYPARPGKGGCPNGPRHGFCLETQFFPDSPNRPEFPSAILRAGEEYDHTTRFIFTVSR